MRDRIPCEFFLLRYVPDVVKGEFVNIGVLLREANSPAPARVRFTRNWSRVRCIDAGADLALLEDLEAEIVRTLAATGETTVGAAVGSHALLATLQDSLSNSLQISEPQVSLAENLATEMDLLMRLYVEGMQTAKVARKATGRPAIFSAMRTEFERAHVWALMSKRLPAERYTRKGDPLRLDCSFRYTNGAPTIRIFHAVSLDGDIEMAKVLAFAAPRLHEGIARLESASLKLTAVVERRSSVVQNEEEPSEAKDRYGFGLETMEEAGVHVITVNDLARAAATAQHDLGL